MKIIDDTDVFTFAESCRLLPKLTLSSISISTVHNYHLTVMLFYLMI